MPVNLRKWKSLAPFSGRRTKSRAEQSQGGFRPARRAQSSWSEHQAQEPALGRPGRRDPHVQACGTLIKATGARMERGALQG